MDIKIKSGPEGYEVIDSGTVITFGEEKFTFHFPGDLRVSIHFQDDPKTEKLSIEAISYSNNEVELRLTNFNSQWPNGNINPANFLNIDNRRLYLNFVVIALQGSKNKVFHYTWYEREEVSNG